MDIEDVAEVVRRSRLSWFGYLERKEPGDWVSECRNMVVLGKAGRGRLRKRWMEGVEDDLKKGGLDRLLAKDREKWRAQILGKNVQPARARKRDVK